MLSLRVHHPSVYFRASFTKCQKKAAFLMRRAALLLLVVCLLSTSTPAGAQTIVAVAQETSVSLFFWYHASGLAAWLRGDANKKGLEQEKQSDRDAKVDHLQIFPAEVTVDLGQRVRFAAVAFDSENNALGGVKIHWSGFGDTPQKRARVSKTGEFDAMAPGTYKIVAKGAGKSAQVNVTVRPGVRADRDATPTDKRDVSSRDLPPDQARKSKSNEKSDGAVAKDQRLAKAKRSHAAKTTALPAAPMFIGGEWDSSNYWSADDPGNRVGDPPGTSSEMNAGSGNFQFTAPILNLAGRGLDVSLALAYNSRVWNKANNQMSYDNDKGWPAPGFNMGFGKMLGMTIPTGHMLVDADGTRHSYSGSITFYNWGTVGVMHTTDGSFIDYTYQTGTNGVGVWAQAKLPNGTVITYGAYSQPGGGMFPTFIEDANGNFITITYLNNQGPRIQTVTDTLGRVINFHYDGNSLLTAVTAPGYISGTRTLARLHYHQLALNPGFNGQSISVRDWYPWVLDAVYYPATNSGYWLNDSDSYSSYGMLAKVWEMRGMGFSSSGLNDMGTVSQGTLTRSETYNYPLSPNYSLIDAPTYTQKIESWTRDGTNFDSATTGYSVDENATPRVTIVTLPNGTKTKQLAFNAPGQYNDGLIYHDETYVTEGQILSSSTTSWQPGAYGAPRAWRVERTDERNQTKATEFSYGTQYNQVSEIRDYDYGGALLRATRMTYQNSTNYTGGCNSSGCWGRHIFKLPLTEEVYASDYVTRVSRIEYQYDGQTLTAAPNVVMHDQAFNPHAEEEGFCYWDYDWNDPDCTGGCWDYGFCDGYCNQIYVCPYDWSTEFRGNLTQVTTYATASNLTGAVTETRRYDVTGNLVLTSSSCCDQTSMNYNIDTQYGYANSTTRGSPADGYAQVTSSTVFDFNTGLARSARDVNDKESSVTFDPTSLRPLSSISATGSHTDYTYNDSGMSITSTTYLSAGEGGAITEQNVKLLNGRGQVRQEQARAPDEGGVQKWDCVDTTYDAMAQTIKQTRPYRCGTTPPNPVLSTYDAVGRPVKIIAADYTQPDGSDGSTTTTFYNEPTRPSVASSNPGETTRVQDAWGRERWGRTDASGHLVEVVEPDPNSSGSVATNGMVTNYTYNTLGNLTQIVQGDQTRTFKYDALGRMLAQKLAERSATLNDAGTYVGSGTWSDVFTYDARSNLISRTDARGVKTLYTYNNDPLNRLQSVSWDTSGFGDSGNPILASATVSYQYRAKGSPAERKDVTQVASVTTAGVSTESFSYDTQSRISAKTVTLNSRPSYPLVTDYTYDSEDRVKDVLYPAQYGNGSAPRKLIHRDYDIASRVTALTYGGQSFASNVAYNPASQNTSLNVGTGTNTVTETYNYNSQTGALDNQTLTRNGSTLLNLSYDYAGTNNRRTGQLVKITNNLDNNKNRGYEYDGLGRLKRATGGQAVNWAQRYYYDRYGNRNNAFSHTADQYIRNFYQKALDRQPNSTELNSWLSTLQTAYAQGTSQFWSAMQSLGAAVFTSQEYANRGRNDHWYVYDLYQAYLWRDPDPGGWTHWENNTLAVGRNATRAGFDWSLEFELHVSGTAPYSPPGGATVPGDGWGSLHFDNTSNRINDGGWGYDAAGNQTRVYSGTGWQRYQYDAANRLVKVKADDNVTVLASYTYADSNERLIAEEGGQRTYYACERSATIAEYTESGGSTNPVWSKSYVYFGPQLLSTLTPNGAGGEATVFNHPDRLGTRVVTNPANGTSFEQVNLPFGTALASESTGATNRRFTSYDRSSTTGLDYAYNRFYDSQQGRFTQVDPIGIKATDLSHPQTLNLYAYCNNDPVNTVDPSGLGFLSFLKRLFKRIIGALVAAAVAFIFTLVVTGNLPAAFAAAGVTFMDTLLAGPQGYKPKFGTPPTFPVGGISLSDIFQGTILSIFFPGNKDILRWVQGFAGGSLGEALAAMQKPNPNCILNAVANQKGLARPFGNVGPTGIIGHDGVHVVAPAGSVVKTLAGLTGTLIDVHYGGDGTAIVDVLLDSGGVALYKDLSPASVQRLADAKKKGKTVRFTKGSIIGKVSGGGENMGLHFAILRGGMKEHNYYRAITSGQSKNPILVGMFIDPLGPDSPARCPGEPVNHAAVIPYKP